MICKTQSAAARQLGRVKRELVAAQCAVISLTKEVAVLKADLHNAHQALTESETPFYKGMKILNKYA